MVNRQNVEQTSRFFSWRSAIKIVNLYRITLKGGCVKFVRRRSKENFTPRNSKYPPVRNFKVTFGSASARSMG